MRKFATLATLVATLTVSAFGIGGPVPRKAPEFAILPATPGGPQTLLSAYRGKVVVFAFMFTTCPHCQKTAGVLAQVQKEYEAKGVQVLGVTFDQAAKQQVAQFNKMFGVNFPCGYSSEEAVRSFIGLGKDEPYFVPILMFIDKTGMIRSQYIGDEQFLGNQEVNIRAELDKMLKGGATSRTSSAPKSPKS